MQYNAAHSTSSSLSAPAFSRPRSPIPRQPSTEVQTQRRALRPACVHLFVALLKQFPEQYPERPAGLDRFSSRRTTSGDLLMVSFTNENFRSPDCTIIKLEIYSATEMLKCVEQNGWNGMCNVARGSVCVEELLLELW